MSEPILATKKECEVLVSIDPGVHLSGIAVFKGPTLKGSELAYARLIETDPLLICHLIFMETNVGEYPHEVFIHTVVEKPQVYRKSPGDRNDLIDLAVAAGMLGGRFKNRKYVLPREWKGNVPKEIMNDRVLTKLTEDEKSKIEYPKRKSLSHNVLDAVGIGLWALKRL